MLPIIIITAIGLVCGILIYVAFLKIPQRVKGLEQTDEINSILPGQNCGACGFPGCFGFAQALTKNPELIQNTYCALAVQDAERLKRLGEALRVALNASAMNKRALVHCGGNSEVIYNYSGVETCKGAAQLLAGNRKCPYGCLGLGDCIKACLEGAISIDPEKNIAVIDWEKCNGCGLCVPECPITNLIELVPAGTKIAFCCNYLPLRNIPGRERCDFGCDHCRKCFVACNDIGAIIWDKKKATPEFDNSKCTLCLKCVEVCPQKVLANVSREKVAEKESVAA